MNTSLNSNQLQLAREWLFECQWDAEFDNEALLDAQRIQDHDIEAAIQRHFSGGLTAFIATCEVSK